MVLVCFFVRFFMTPTDLLRIFFFLHIFLCLNHVCWLFSLKLSFLVIKGEEDLFEIIRLFEHFEFVDFLLELRNFFWEFGARFIEGFLELCFLLLIIRVQEVGFAHDTGNLLHEFAGLFLFVFDVFKWWEI